jgi:hypothetical protein
MRASCRNGPWHPHGRKRIRPATRELSREEDMPRWTPEEQAAYHLDWSLDPDGLKPEVREIYNKLKAEREAGGSVTRVRPSLEPEGRTPPEVREKILRMLKKAHPKYAKAFTGDRLAMVSIIGTESWADYGQVVLQMAILDTLLSIEERLAALESTSTARGAAEKEEQ